nr:transglycosylase family protein [Nitriliruptor alkaliphilus]
MLLRHARRSVTILLAALLALLTLPALTTTADAATFRDTAGSVYQEAVDALAAEGIIKGCTEDDFCPNRPILRGQMATMIARALDLEATRSAGFRDVSGVHESSIDALAEAGITKGCATGRFCPTSSTTRAEMASFIDRAFSTTSTSDTWFVDTSGTHAGAIDRLAASGITAGCATADTHFCPGQSVLRGQVALFLARTLELVPRVEPVRLADREAAARTSSRTVWDDLARCESGENWSINTGNGYYGGLQFTLSSWRGVGGSGYPHHHSRAEQIKRGERLQAQQGWGAWPHCSRKLGLR